MSLIPVFEIGLWNAWIPMLCSLVPVFLSPLIAKDREKGANFTAAFNRERKNAPVGRGTEVLELGAYDY